MSEEICAICATDQIKFIECPKCHFSACKTCTEKFLLTTASINPQCMNCKIEWNMEFLADKDYDFYSGYYRDHVAKILLEREKSLLPATQVYAEKIKHARRLREKILTPLLEKMEEYKAIYRALEKEYKKFRNIVNKLESECSKKPNNDEEKKVNSYYAKCPQEDCKGYLNNKYKCGICNKKACKKCELPEHEDDCDPNIVATVNLIKKDTKTCPNCRTLIYKIDGCDQMFCTKCHAVFSWRTGAIEKGRIHNPHYYEFVRANGEQKREIGDVRCGGQVNFSTLYAKINDDNLSSSIQDLILNSHQLSGHIRGVTLNRYEEVSNDESNRQLRIQYLLNELTEQQWISHIKRKEKKREKNIAISQVLTMFVDTIDSIHDNICNSTYPNIITKSMEELECLKEYTNNAFRRIGLRFQNKVPIIDDNWVLRDIGGMTSSSHVNAKIRAERRKKADAKKSLN
jgi:hypothetical protein